MSTRPTIAPEADWDQAPSLLEGAAEIELSLHECELEYWLRNVAQGSVVGLVHGRRPNATMPRMLLDPGPLRESRIGEVAFRSLSEEAATRVCAMITGGAPDTATMEFFATQALDEARHAHSFRWHLVDLGIPEEQLAETVEAAAGGDRDRIIAPMWEWALPVVGDVFINAVVVITILLEGVLAPTTELAERKWKPISEASADIERGACVDEIRHLAVGSWIVRDHLRRHGAQERERILRLLEIGREQWASLPVAEMLMEREELFQRGIEEHRDAIGDYEIFTGQRLVDTTVEDRVAMAAHWSVEVQDQRMRWMGFA